MARKIAEQTARRYACRNCGHPFDAYPPDDGHNIAMLEPCSKGDSIEIQYECQDCHHRNPIHWDIHHVVVVSGSYKSRGLYDDL